MNYYNEFDHNAAEWLRELILEGLIPVGDVDERSIIDVRADDIRGYTQCHFFAGIGGWSLALQLAGWSKDQPVWTGSCPCQPYSCAGKQLGNADERDLWPAFFRLIAECHPEFVFGEQVENAIRHGWLDRVCTDLERENYSVGSVVLGAHSVGSPHKRQRLYWGGVRMADNDGKRFKKGRKHCYRSEERSSIRRELSGVSFFHKQGLGRRVSVKHSEQSPVRESCSESLSSWRNSEFILCRDGKTRRVPFKSLLFGLADGVPEGVDENRIESISEIDGFPLTTQKEGWAMLIKGYGNAIVPQVASEFIQAFYHSVDEK